MPENQVLIPVATDKTLNAWRAYLLIACSMSCLVLIQHLQAKSEAEAAVLFGFSAARILLGVVILSGVVAFGGLLIRSWVSPAWFVDFCNRLNVRIAQPVVWGSAFALSLLVLVGAVYALLLTPEIEDLFTRLIFERLSPLILLIVALCAQNLILLAWLRYGNEPKRLGKRLAVLGLLVGVLLLLLGLWRWVVQTQFASESQVLGWNELGAPLLETQVFLVWVIGMGVYFLVEAVFSWKRFSLHWIDVVLGLVIWVGTLLLWQAMPLSANWFVTDPRAPNDAFYPDSDAASYDLVAQNLMLGEGFDFSGLPFIRRPVHGLYLLFLHLLGGQDYESIINYQLLILATLPVLIYLMTTRLHNRLSGIFAAGLIAVREANSIAAASRITTSNAKTLLVDLPTTLVVVLFTYLVIASLQNYGRKPALFVAAGGVMGALLLLRPETLALLLPLFVIMALAFWKKPALIFRSGALFLLGSVLVLSPWIWRNYQVTGMLLVGEDPSFRLFSILERYREQAPVPTPTQPTPLSGVEQVGAWDVFPAHKSSKIQSSPIWVTYRKVEQQPPDPPMPTPVPTSGDPADLLGELWGFLRANGGDVARFAAVHYVHNQMQALLVLPTASRPLESLVGYLGHRQAATFWDTCCSLNDYIRRVPYWRKWDGHIPASAVWMLAVNFLLSGCGIYLAWRKNRLIGVIPLVFSITYLLTNAIFRNSGGRYILPFDWVSILYFSIGLAALSLWIVEQLSRQRLAEQPGWIQVEPVAESSISEPSVWRSPGFYAASLSCLLLGVLLVLAEFAIPVRYNDQMKTALLEKALSVGPIAQADRDYVENVLNAGGVVNIGRGVYPRFVRPNDHEFPGKTADLMQPYRRIVFELVGANDIQVIMPVESRPAYFPNGADIVLISTANSQPVAVVVFNTHGEPEEVLLRSPGQR